MYFSFVLSITIARVIRLKKNIERRDFIVKCKKKKYLYESFETLVISY